MITGAVNSSVHLTIAAYLWDGAPGSRGVNKGLREARVYKPKMLMVKSLTLPLSDLGNLILPL